MLTEQALCQRLGIPQDVKQVLIFPESSHWDPDWIFTSEEYFERFVCRNLDRAIEELQREPRRIYSVENVFFLRMYWERCPEQRDAVRDLINTGRLRLTSSGVTTADTLLPSAEAILRDWLIGQEWLRKNGLKQEPKLAYFADSFGCTPFLPSLLQAAGFDYAAITRVDGMYFPGCDLELPSRFPRSGSTAKKLLYDEHSLDFVWRDPNGAEVLCHWNTFTYGQGDMLAYVGLSRVYLARLAFPLRADWHVARRIKQYVTQLMPYSRTPYMLCPIGFDFVEPIPDLMALLDRYNRRYYPDTGIWAVNAGLDDYLALVECHRDELPVLAIDPNPYWTGFYTSRPTLKQRCCNLVEELLLVEKLALLPNNQSVRDHVLHDMESAWWAAAVSNHHDFITGTSPDRVVDGEQIPWLDKALVTVEEVKKRLEPSPPLPTESPVGNSPLDWKQEKKGARVDTPYYHVEIISASYWPIIHLWRQSAQTPLLTGMSNEVIGYRDSGGLWRMGYEFVGGVWRETLRASMQPGKMWVREHENGIEIVSTVRLGGEDIRQRIWFSTESPLIYFRVEGRAPQGYSLAIRFETGIHSQHLTMDTPGGVISRPPQKIYSPTFWPLHHFVHVQDEDTGKGFAVFQRLPGAVSYQEDGRLELIVMRNATRETAFRMIKLPANPASDHESEPYTFEYALLFTEKGDWLENKLHLLARDVENNPWQFPGDRALLDLAEPVVVVSPTDVRVTAVKLASRGEGVIVRLNAPAPLESTVVISPGFKVSEAFLCDARERDVCPLEVANNTVQLEMHGSISTVRLV